MPDPVQVRAMFGRIAGRYDLLNRCLSLGIDQRWRRRVLAQAGPLEGRTVVDACCGTGDLTLAFDAAGAHALGVDFTPQMLTHARSKDRAGDRAGDRAEARAGPGPGRFVLGDALRLPVRSRAADVASIAFGLRNLADRVAGLAELARVVRPGGKVLVLEFSMPPGRLMGSVYRFYFTRVLPRVGASVSGDPGAYRYLPDTVLAWPGPEALGREMEGVGLVDCGWRLFSRGIACLSWGTVPGGARP